MKKLLLVLCGLLVGGLISHAQPSYKMLEQLYTPLVEDGKVYYKTAKEKQKELKKVVEAYAGTPIDSLTKADLINLYNLEVIRKISIGYPVSSVNDIPNFFEEKNIALGGETFSLNEIEEHLRNKYQDPRIHFALVCGAISCPPLRELPFTSKNINYQLEEHATKSLNNGVFVNIYYENQQVEASQIFQWYAADFGGSDEILSYLNSYIPGDISHFSLSYYPYDWSLNEAQTISVGNPTANIQTQTPSRLFSKHSWEFKSFSNLYSQTAFYDGKGSKTAQNNRSSYLTLLNQFLYGVTDRLNVGIEGWIQSASVGSTEDSPFRPYLFQNITGARANFTYLGPKIKYQLFKKLPNLSLQSSFMAPVGQDLDGSATGDIFLASDRYLWLTQVFYDLQLNPKWNVFFQVAPWVSFDREGNTNQNKVETPISAFLSFFPTDRWTLYVQQEFWPTWGMNPVLSAYFRQEGFGVKYQVIKGVLELEASNTYFTSGMNQGAGYTVNFGLRWVKFR